MTIDEKFKEAEDIYQKARILEADCDETGDYSKPDKEYAKVISIYKELAETNHPLALYKLGHCYSVGIGVQGGKSDYAKAAECFRKAAELGNTDAQKALAGLKEEGII